VILRDLIKAYHFPSHYTFQSNVVFDLLKAHLKRAPSLRGAALVRLASLKFQAEPWPPLLINKTEALAKLYEVSFSFHSETAFFSSLLNKIYMNAILILIYRWK
jgi:hypothetical protein